MKLSVIIVSYNVKYFLEQCLYSVLNATRSLDAEIIVVDNHSTDGSIEYLLPSFSNVIFIQNEENLGFGKANNLALQTARGEYILFLNPDTLVPADCFEQCISFLDSHSSAGALGIKMIDGTGCFLPESKRSFPTTLSAFYKLMGLSGLFPSSKHFNKYSLSFLDENNDHSVEVLAGAFMMVRKNVLNKTGGFDEQFFMYGEDIDLSYRIKQNGFENWYFAGSSIIHFKGESTKKESFKYVKMFYEAMIVFVNKHYKGNGAWLTRSILKTGIALRGVAGLLPGSSANKKETKPAQRIIIGPKDIFDECNRILRVNEDDTTTIHIEWVDVDELVGTLRSFPGSEVVFCIAGDHLKTAMAVMHHYKDSFRYRFHVAGSNSIVGSDSKETVGEALASH